MRATFQRWIRFNIVGVAGFAVQLSTLALLARATDLPIALCVAVAVLTAVTHNFLAHEHYTWRRSAHGRAARWLAFTLSNGALSLLSNLLITVTLVSLAPRLPVLLANGAAVAVSSLLNFLIADRAIFRQPAARAGK